MSPAPVLALSDIVFAFPGADRPLLDFAQLEVAAGERVMIEGASGSGKTTLLALIAGVITPRRGRIGLLGRDLACLSAGRRDLMRADHIGFIFQLFNLIPYLTARENLLLGLRFSRARAGRVKDPQEEALRLGRALGLDPALLDRRPGRLSVGQQQRVAAARALIGAPEILLADEPTSALDEDTKAGFLDLLFAESARARSAVLFVTHDRTLRPHFDRVLTMAELSGGAGRA